MGGRIDCYLDIVSLFSYVCFADLRNNLEKLAENDVQVDFHPVFLGGINNLSGNSPPWFLPAKAKYLAIDSRRATERVAVPFRGSPPNLMDLAKTVSPLRALYHIKENYPQETFLDAFYCLFLALWTPPHMNLADDQNLASVLAAATRGADGGGEKLFSEKDVEAIMAGRSAMKERVKEKTGEAVARGAFGAPWIWATNSVGEAEPFFGSDRFNHIYRFLGVPFQDVEILPPKAKL